MSSSCCHTKETNSQIHCQSFSSTASDEEDLIDGDDDDDDDSNDRSIESTEKQSNDSTKNKKTLGRVKIKMAYIDNKIRRYTTFSKRETGIMKKAYELATLTGTEVMLLVASETGHVYTYATAKLQPMITSEAGKALIQTCLAKDESIMEQVAERLRTPSVTTLSNHDVIVIDENQRKKRTTTPIDGKYSTVHSYEKTNGSKTIAHGNRPIKRAKLKSSDELSSLNKTKPTEDSSNVCSTPHQSLSMPCFIQSNTQQQTTVSPPYTIDLNTLKPSGMNIIFTPSTPNISESLPHPSSSPLIVTLGNFSYQPS